MQNQNSIVMADTVTSRIASGGLAVAARPNKPPAPKQIIYVSTARIFSIPLTAQECGSPWPSVAMHWAFC